MYVRAERSRKKDAEYHEAYIRILIPNSFATSIVNSSERYAAVLNPIDI